MVAALKKEQADEVKKKATYHQLGEILTICSSLLVGNYAPVNPIISLILVSLGAEQVHWVLFELLVRPG